MDPAQFTESRILQMIAEIAAYLRQERALYFPASVPLCPTRKTALQPYFPKTLLDTVKTVTLDGARIPPPPFYADAVAISGGHFPDFVHLASVTYLDVIVFNDPIIPRPLFHGLVHAQQMSFLNLDRYVGFYLRGFLKMRSWINIPLEAQAFQLEARFSMTPPEVFSVEEEVKRWSSESRY